MTAPKSSKPVTPMFAINADLKLPAGRYLKTSESRIGTAYVEISPEGDLTYSNRDGKTEPITLSRFASLYKAGMSTPAGTAATAAKVTRAPLAT